MLRTSALWALPPFLLLTLLDTLVPARASPFPVPPIRRVLGRAASDFPVSASRRTGADAGKGYGFTHAAGELYSGTVFVNGVPYQMLLDTGSSDTWIDPVSLSAGGEPPPGLLYTGANSTATYLDGSSYTGAIVLADIDFGPFSIRNQALTLAYDAVATTASTSGLFNGILGLGGLRVSDIATVLHDTRWEPNGVPVIYNLFAHLPDAPAYSTWLPARSDLGLTDGGVLTFSEVIADKMEVLDAPRIESVHRGTWTARMDGVYVNGVFLSGRNGSSRSVAADEWRSGLEGDIEENDLVASFDTGSSYIYALKNYVEAVYKGLPGAFAEEDDDGDVLWHVPCGMKANVSFVFGGQAFPLHPVDLTRIVVHDDGTLECYGTLIGSGLVKQDFLLGDTFLRNVYALYGYPDVHDPATAAYIQMLSTTDAETAWAEADALFLERLLAFDEAFGTPDDEDEGELETAPELPAYTGPRTSVSVTAAATRSATARPVKSTVTAEAAEKDAGKSDHDASPRPVLRIALGITCGVLSVLAVAGIIVLLRRRQRARGRYGGKERRSGARGEKRAEEEVELLASQSPVDDVERTSCTAIQPLGRPLP